jgi:hypothetical protein
LFAAFSPHGCYAACWPRQLQALLDRVMTMRVQTMPGVGKPAHVFVAGSNVYDRRRFDRSKCRLALGGLALI